MAKGLELAYLLEEGNIKEFNKFIKALGISASNISMEIDININKVYRVLNGIGSFSSKELKSLDNFCLARKKLLAHNKNKYNDLVRKGDIRGDWYFNNNNDLKNKLRILNIKNVDIAKLLNLNIVTVCNKINGNVKASNNKIKFTKEEIELIHKYAKTRKAKIEVTVKKYTKEQKKYHRLMKANNIEGLAYFDKNITIKNMFLNMKLGQRFIAHAMKLSYSQTTQMLNGHNHISIKNGKKLQAIYVSLQKLLK